MSDESAPPFFLPPSCSRSRASSALCQRLNVFALWSTVYVNARAGRTLFLLFLLLCSNQALTEFLLLFVEACSTVWRDIGKRRSSLWALHRSCGSKGPRANREGL